MTPPQRRWFFLLGAAGLAAFVLWGLAGLPGFGRYPGPYGNLVNALAVAQTHATGVVSAVNFEYRGFDTLGEEFILFAAATGVSVVLRHLREERETSPQEASEGSPPGGVGDDGPGGRRVPPTGDAVRMVCLAFTGPTLVVGWYIVSHGQVSPGGGFQGGVILASAFLLVYLAGQFVTFRRLSPVAVTDAVEGVGAGSFAAIGLAALGLGTAYLTNVLPLGTSPGSVDSSGTIALISFFVGIEVTAAFVLIVSELLDQTLLIRSP